MIIDGQDLRKRREGLGLSQAKLAELVGISQHLLSAFELEKTVLPENMLAAISSAIKADATVAAIVNRKKRYRTHEYASSPRQQDRAAQAKRTPGNGAYMKALAELARFHAAPKTSGLSALSLFSGCGGLSLGFSAAGFSLKGFLELDPGLRRIYAENFPDSLELGGDITEFAAGALERSAQSIGEIDVLVGGPPCQGFSLSGKRRVDDPRNKLFRHYLTFVDIFRPKLAVMENVRLLTSMKTAAGTSVKDEILREFREHGYRVSLFEINAKDYGVPQHRERVFFVAVRNDLGFEPTIPSPTHQVGGDLFCSSLPRSFGDACSDLPYLESGEAAGDPLHAAVTHPEHVVEWLWDVKEGRSAHDNEDPQKRPPSGYNTTYKRQVWVEPASTVQTTFGMISGCRNVHPIATRSLTIREAARVQSFPDSYRFEGSLGCIRTGIGNAVPPLLAFALARHLARDLQML